MSIDYKDGDSGDNIENEVQQINTYEWEKKHSNAEPILARVWQPNKRGRAEREKEREWESGRAAKVDESTKATKQNARNATLDECY